jgi:hypothetical protein
MSSPSHPLRNAASFVVAFAFTLLALAGFNAVGDPYADCYFLTGFRQPEVRTLDFYADVKFKSRLVRDLPPGSLGAAIFGSSRVMRIDPAEPTFAQLVPRAVNLGIQGARLGQTVQFVKLVTRRNPECIPVVGLDFFAFNPGASGRSIYLDDARPFPAQREAFLRLASNRTCSEAWKAIRQQPCPTRLLANGLAARARPEAAYVETQLKNFAAQGWATCPNFRDFRYDRTKIEIVRHLRAEHPRTVFFVNPVSRAYREGQLKAGLELDYAEWRADLARVGRILDFSDVEEIVGNPARFYDPHHYDDQAGGMIIRDVAAYLRGEPLRYARLLGSASPAP